MSRESLVGALLRLTSLVPESAEKNRRFDDALTIATKLFDAHIMLAMENRRLSARLAKLRLYAESMDCGCHQDLADNRRCQRTCHRGSILALSGTRGSRKKEDNK